MLDLSKFIITDEDLINTVWNNELLEYVGKSERLYIDEIKEKQTKKYKNLYFTKFQNRLEICGSIHYLFLKNDLPIMSKAYAHLINQILTI